MKFKVKKLVALSSIFISLIMLFTLISPNTITFANSRDFDSEDEIIENELKFYFSEVGYLDKNGKYIITNPSILKERADRGDEQANKLYLAYYFKEVKKVDEFNKNGYLDFGKCILYKYLGPVYELMDGKFAEALASQVASDSWRAAGKILKMAISEASKIAGRTIGGAFTVAELAYYAYTCRDEL